MSWIDDLVYKKDSKVGMTVEGMTKTTDGYDTLLGWNSDQSLVVMKVTTGIPEQVPDVFKDCSKVVSLHLLFDLEPNFFLRDE